jgi:hypothetical protein
MYVGSVMFSSATSGRHLVPRVRRSGPGQVCVVRMACARKVVYVDVNEKCIEKLRGFRVCVQYDIVRLMTYVFSCLQLGSGHLK